MLRSQRHDTWRYLIPLNICCMEKIQGIHSDLHFIWGISGPETLVLAVLCRLSVLFIMPIKRFLLHLWAACIISIHITLDQRFSWKGWRYLQHISAEYFPVFRMFRMPQSFFTSPHIITRTRKCLAKNATFGPSPWNKLFFFLVARLCWSCASLHNHVQSHERHPQWT